jgi:hypothetical protein
MAYDTVLGKEAKVGAMLRTMTGDMAARLKAIIEELYGDTDIGKICAKWHMIVMRYASSMEEARPYTAIILLCHEYNINLDECDEWKRLMRWVLPEEFYKTVDAIGTQVPKLAARDETHLPGGIIAKDAKEVNW